MIEFVCDIEKRHSNTTKIIKILNWSSCQNVVDVREFIEICVFYRVFIADFVFIAQLIYAFLKKNVSFVWKLAQQKAMNIFKIVFINSFVFTFIDYTIDVVILAMCYVLVLSTNTSHLVISSSLSIKQACLTILIILQSIEFLDSLIMFRFSTNELKNEQEISDENFIERFTKRFISWYSHHDLKTT
jgi:hypothetical protein